MNLKINSYKELVLWQRAVELTVEIYQVIRKLPKEEMYALASQMRRAAVSIPSNIAEGHGRNTTKEFIQFLYIARGSKSELETQLEICKKLEYLKNADIKKSCDLADEVGKIINSMIKKLNARC